ncbi:MAG: KamA family radical SAM protein [Deltaproteobacteria bacterium]|nr:KamA family radical SAM protein [Deltaproteobacteria bacterium]
MKSWSQTGPASGRFATRFTKIIPTSEENSVESVLEPLAGEEPPDPLKSLTIADPAQVPPLYDWRTRTEPRRFPSPHIDEFRRRFFPQAGRTQWNDWRWQLAHRVTSLADLERVLNLSTDERLAFSWPDGALPCAVTPYYLSLVDRDNSRDPVRRCVIPTIMEHAAAPGEAADPLHEDQDSPVPGLVHRYPDRVLFLATGFCSTYCRYCTRSRMVGDDHSGTGSQWKAALDYISRTPTIRDVLVSGGDPLTMTDEALDWLLGRLRRIPHVEFIRIGSKVPAVLPQRVTKGLVRVLRKYHPLWVSLHFTHPRELTPETAGACERLADAGIPLGSQTVLLQGVNDDPAVLKSLYHGLLRVRVRPYYLYQCDPISGSAHFRTTVSKGLEVMSSLRGHTTGYAVPTYVIDAPGGGGKIPVYPRTMVGCDELGLALMNYEGKTFHYPDFGSERSVEDASCAWA